MSKLAAIILLFITLSFLNRGYSQGNFIDYRSGSKLTLIETEEEIIMMNSLMAVRISKETGEISSLMCLKAGTPNLLADSAQIIIRDVKEGLELRQSDGDVAMISTEEYSDSVRAIFDIKFFVSTLSPPPTPQYQMRIIFTLDLKALRWAAELHTGLSPDREANIDFSVPISSEKMEYAFWTEDDAPFKLPISRYLEYRSWPFWMPIVILYNMTSNFGLSFVSPFELKKPGLKYHLHSPDTLFNISNYYLRLGINHPARTALYIVPHEGDWRPGIAWLYNKYPEYFNPVSQRVLAGEGWYTMGNPFTKESEMADAQRRFVTWEEFHGHFPFYGLYAPWKDKWMLIMDRDDISLEDWENDNNPGNVPTTGYTQNNNQISLWHKDTIQSYIYFQSFESWHQYSDSFFKDDIAKNLVDKPLPAWKFCNLMNPDPNTSWGKHIISQIDTLLSKYPDVDGIFYDRDDYWNYDYAHNDSVTMIDTTPVYMLGFAQEKINDSILMAVHSKDKGVWTNCPTSIEVCKGMDGIMSEGLLGAASRQYLGINRPLILLTYDRTPIKTEEKLKTALYTGHFPSITWSNDGACKDIEKRYQPLFRLYKGKNWVLDAQALQFAKGLKGNIFQTPDKDYLIALIDPEKYLTNLDPFYYDKWAKVKLPDKPWAKVRRPMGHGTDYCYLLSGDYKGVNQVLDYTKNGREITVNLPLHRSSSLLQLSKEPRYEVTRISSPILVRGENETFVVKIQNIGNSNKEYHIRLITPFGESELYNFTLPPEESKELALGFVVPEDTQLGEVNMTVLFPEIPLGDNNEVVFTAWIVDLLSLGLPEKFFVHFDGEVFPFTLVNNTGETLYVVLYGEFVEGSGIVTFPDEDKDKEPPWNVVLEPFEAKELLVKIESDTEQGKVAIYAIKLDTDRCAADTIPVERAMIPRDDDLFKDDFSSGNMNNWNIKHGTWEVIDGRAKGSGDWHFARKDGNWADFKYQINTKIQGSTDPFIYWLKSYIFFRVQDDKNYYRFGIHGPAGLDLYKRVNNEWSVIKYISFQAKKDVWYNLRVEVKGDSIKGFWDGNLVISVTDTTFSSGGIGIGVLEDWMVTYYDDVVVRKIPSDEP